MRTSKFVYPVFLLVFLLTISCGDSDEPILDDPDDDDGGSLEMKTGTWTTGLSMPVARKEIANATVFLDGKIYVVGGVERSGTISNRLDIYDIANDTWAEGENVPVQVWRATASAANGKLYLFGGYKSLNPFPFSPSKEVFEYDIGNDTWTQKGDMPVERGAAVSLTLNDRIYLIGGARNSALSRMDIYNPSSDSWGSSASMSRKRSGLSGVVHDGKIYVFGGYELINGGVVSTNTGEVFANGSWSSIASIPSEKLGIDVASLGEMIYLFGGTSNSELSAIQFDPVSNAWEEVNSMPTPVSFMGVAANGTSVFVLGGGPVNLNRSDAVRNNRVFNP